MGRRPQRWDPRGHDPAEVDRRNVELEQLQRSDAWLFAVLARANSYGLAEADVIRRAHRLRKRVPETRRRGPSAIYELRVRLDQEVKAVLAALPTPALRSGATDSRLEGDTVESNLALDRGAVIRRPKGLTQERARLQARIIAPVLTQEKTVRQVAEEWREEFRKSERGEASGILAEFPPALHRAYPDLSYATVSRWAGKVRKARAEASKAGVPAPTAMEALLSRKPPRWAERQRKRTAEVHSHVVASLIHDPEQSSRDLASQIGDISPRTIRRLIRKDIPPALLAIIKGGDEAAAEMLYSRLPRRPPYFGHTYLIDDSTVQNEIVEHEYHGVLEDFDFEFHCVHRDPQEGGLWLSKRVPTLYLQSVVDGYSRMKLVHRLFPYRPTSLDTLVTLAAAAFRYGLPEILRSDNGSNFKSGLVRARLDEAGVDQVFSLPTQPRGRGIQENWFWVLKRALFNKLPGAMGRSRKMEDLLDLERLQAILNVFVDEGFNNRYHRMIGMSPREAMERSVERLSTTDSKRILCLLPRVARTTRNGLVEFAKGVYRCDGLVTVPNGSEVNVYSVPPSLDRVWLSWRHPNGDEVFLGDGVRVDEAAPAPEIGEIREVERAILKEVLGEALPLIEAQRRKRNRIAREVRAEKRAETDAAEVVALLQQARRGKRPALPAGREKAAPKSHPFKRVI